MSSFLILQMKTLGKIFVALTQRIPKFALKFHIKNPNPTLTEFNIIEPNFKFNFKEQEKLIIIILYTVRSVSMQGYSYWVLLKFLTDLQSVNQSWSSECNLLIFLRILFKFLKYKAQIVLLIIHRTISMPILKTDSVTNNKYLSK